jgi:hypothetical protein
MRAPSPTRPTRAVRVAAVWFALAALVVGIALSGPAQAGLGLQASPSAATPAAAVTPAPTDVVTLVGFYLPATDASGDYLSITSIASSPDLVTTAGPVPAGQQPGRADFPVEGLPTIVLGDTTFEAYSLIPEDPGAAYNWIWFNGEETARPATLVLQITGSGGRYDGYIGTATFASRDENSGGVLVLMIRPDEAPAAEGTTTAEQARLP